MGEFPRKSDGRRVFTVEFKRGVVQPLLKGDKTLAKVSRELDIQPSVVRQWRASAAVRRVAGHQPHRGDRRPSVIRVPRMPRSVRSDPGAVLHPGAQLLTPPGIPLTGPLSALYLGQEPPTMVLYVVYARLFRQQDLYPVYARPWDYGFTLPDRDPWQDEGEGG